jgi:hypothetical protein
MHLRALFVVPSILCFSTFARGAPPHGSLTVQARGAYAVTLDGRREILGLVSLTVPLDRVAAPRIAEAKPKKAKSVEPEAPQAPAPAPVPAPAAPTSVELPRPILGARLVNATLAAAYRAAGRSRAHARYASLSSRARASAALPELRLRAARSTDESLRLTPTSSDPYRYTQAGGVTVSFEGQATWRLDRLVFADEEISIEHLANSRSRADSALTEQVLKTLFQWQRARLTAAREDVDPEARLEAELRAVEAALRLDVLTGGWFSARVDKGSPSR